MIGEHFDEYHELSTDDSQNLLFWALLLVNGIYIWQCVTWSNKNLRLTLTMWDFQTARTLDHIMFEQRHIDLAKQIIGLPKEESLTYYECFAGLKNCQTHFPFVSEWYERRRCYEQYIFFIENRLEYWHGEHLTLWKRNIKFKLVWIGLNQKHHFR